MAAGWLDIDSRFMVERYWPQSADLTHGELEVLLASSLIQCEAFAPALAATAVVPDNYRHAQALQARALYRSSIAGENNGIGIDGQALTVFPMDWTVKALLRPKRGPWVK